MCEFWGRIDGLTSTTFPHKKPPDIGLNTFKVTQSTQNAEKFDAN